MLREFKEFISRGNVMDMAVGIIIGAAFTAIVGSLVADIIMPLVGVLLSGVDFADWFIALDGGKYASLKAAKDAGAPVLSYGVFINAVINFLIVAFAVFLIVKGVNRMKRPAANPPAAPDAPPPPPPQDIVLLTEIRDLLKK
ncbi:MAG: large conductance mechanosensitive channel protein MscL [Methylobacteriaceae bacterium]|jgi:large conductance mechanosensitive channel|nr:large conductance mechanosensitive channel protein MscL [Methylobacteriaceae bacterium]